MQRFSKIVFVAVLLMVLLRTSVTQTVEDCIRRNPKLATNALCDVRQYRVTRGTDVDQYVKCVLAALGFAAEDGSIMRNVVLAALDAVETHDGVYTDSVDVCLSRSKKLPGAERPATFYSCMLQTESAQNFKDALELQELKAASEWGESETFDRSKVEQKMREVNSKLKC